MNNRKEDMEISSHYRQLLRELNEQRQHGILCDACVIVDGKIFKAHKNVLLGSSRYFKTLYCQVKKGAEPHHQTTVTHLDIVTATGFKAILDFMYSAHLALTSKNVIEVMSAASYLQMTDIVQACHSFIKAALDISIRSEMADELADFEMGAVAAAGIGGGGGGGVGGGGVGIVGAGGVGGAGLGAGGGGIVGMASEALASIMSGRSTSPWLGRRTSPANSSGDSAIASCHEGGSTYGKEDQEPPKSHESQEEACHDSQPAWPHDYRPVTVKEEQVSPASSSHPRDTPRGAAQSQAEPGAGGTGGAAGEGPWQPLSGSGRRKNRKNKDTVRHITQQAERNGDRERDRERDRDSRPGSPLPSMLAVAGWNYNGQEIPGADVTEPNSSDSRGERLDFFLKQEEALAAESGFLGGAGGGGESEEAAGGGGVGGGVTAAAVAAASVANLKAALMSKNSLLSLRAEMMGEDNPLLYEYLPKGGHSLSRGRERRRPRGGRLHSLGRRPVSCGEGSDGRGEPCWRLGPARFYIRGWRRDRGADGAVCRVRIRGESSARARRLARTGVSLLPVQAAVRQPGASQGTRIPPCLVPHGLVPGLAGDERPAAQPRPAPSPAALPASPPPVSLQARSHRAAPSTLPLLPMSRQLHAQIQRRPPREDHPLQEEADAVRLLPETVQGPHRPAQAPVLRPLQGARTRLPRLRQGF
ncbi:zinc finger and BTB domain-containing protein 46 isoform X2 [Genypterus blacodes]|uniref:zinc finger and BTB domain-containing protein 46 isoform X2 n=1 Tax=Genypterus blacodes TaxID=154954 RepID=UPI003F75CE6F